MVPGVWELHPSRGQLASASPRLRPASSVLCKALEMPSAGKVLSNTASPACSVSAMSRCCIEARPVLCACLEIKQRAFFQEQFISASRGSYSSRYFTSTDHHGLQN